MTTNMAFFAALLYILVFACLIHTDGIEHCLHWQRYTSLP